MSPIPSVGSWCRGNTKLTVWERSQVAVRVKTSCRAKTAFRAAVSSSWSTPRLANAARVQRRHWSILVQAGVAVGVGAFDWPELLLAAGQGQHEDARVWPLMYPAACTALTTGP